MHGHTKHIFLNIINNMKFLIWKSEVQLNHVYKYTAQHVTQQQCFFQSNGTGDDARQHNTNTTSIM